MTNPAYGFSPPGRRRAVWTSSLLFCFALQSPATERLAVTGLGQPAFADRETSATFALPRPPEKNWRLTLSPGEMTASNRVDAAFGADEDGDGALASGETSAVIGYECGAWFVLGGGFDRRWSAPASGGPLVLDIRLSETGSLLGFSFQNGGGAVVFGGLPPMAAFLNPARWDAVRLTARGPSERGEALAVATFADGSTFILK